MLCYTGNVAMKNRKSTLNSAITVEFIMSEYNDSENRKAKTVINT